MRLRFELVFHSEIPTAHLQRFAPKHSLLGQKFVPNFCVKDRRRWDQPLAGDLLSHNGSIQEVYKQKKAVTFL